VSSLPRGVTAIAAGGSHNCALTSAGAVECWGWNKFGQLGDGTRITRVRPVAVSGVSSDVTSLDVGSTHTCALTAAGRVLCWGANDVGQLGNGGTASRPTPVAVSGLGGGVAAITAWNQTCARMDSGKLECWGYNYDGEVGDGTERDRRSPVDVTGF
jgi:alpha-tubulin suppressor-like RCC1 family protein